ncbi:UDP-glucose 4-epimerase GalE [Streptoverticillium reticulum]|uniref:UDP-glucose 4-epimerase GalE n=1 Tax=Streptoverticillium reticulum TaxID=1433415 RepID=UPI0039BFCDEC
MTYLITGGAGYIGAHVVRALRRAGEQAVVLDDLSTGDASTVPEDTPLAIGSVLDRAFLDRVFSEHRVTGVIHVAGKKQVGESVARPLYYYRENVTGLQTLLEATVEAGVKNFVFSSSAAVYGMPDVDVVTEDMPCAPISPYGETKLVGEWMVRAVGAKYGMATACLRYFNVAGAAMPELSDSGVFNLIPMVFERFTAGERPHIFGNDYPTPDGTCIRDYIHVEDLSEAHVEAAHYLAALPTPQNITLNVGRGEGTSVLDMVELVTEVSRHHELPPVVVQRRPGDPARLVASADLISAKLDWKARHGIRDMAVSAWHGWLHRHPRG